MKKSVIAVLTGTIILLSMLAPLLFIQPVKAADPTDWYMTVPGVLDSDTYYLYPYEPTSLTIGFSKFGEMINPDGIGLMYGSSSIQTENIDPFAADTYVPEFEWNQGWLINITYSYSGEFRNVWAFALYSDSYNNNSIGGDWKMAPTPDSSTVLGGRKYGGIRYNSGAMTPIGYATTAPLTVLYDGPRSFVALSQTIIGEDSGTPLVGVYITVVFDKVKKYVMLYKDVKLLDERKFTSDLQVEFSNRGEWDLGLTARPASYAHWFEDYPTSYWTGYQPFYSMEYTDGPLIDGGHPALVDVAQVISSSTPGYVGYAAYWPTPISIWMEATYLTDRSTMLTSLETTIANFTGNGSTTWQLPTGENENRPVEYPRGQGVWADDPMVFVNGAIRPENASDPSGWAWENGSVVFTTAPSSGAQIWIEYKKNVHKTDMSDAPRTPYIIGEWDFVLGWANVTASTNQFRAVTCYGVTDDHDASQSNLDREVQYQLDEVFNPYDLNSAVWKDSNRYVEFSDDPIGGTGWITEQRPVIAVSASEWDQYGVFSERVEDLTTGTVLNRYNGDYSFTEGSDGYGVFTGLNATHYYKFLYSTGTEYSRTLSSINVRTQTVNSTSTSFDWGTYVDQSYLDPTGVVHQISSDDLVFSFTNTSTTAFAGNYTWTYDSPWVEWDHSPFLVTGEDAVSPYYYFETEAGTTDFNVTTVSNSTATLDFNLSAVELYWDISFDPSGPLFTDLKSIYFDSFNADYQVEITVSYNMTTGNYTVSAAIIFGAPDEGYSAGYDYYLPGGYEWVAVGRDASTVDSAGATVVAAAFKNKGVEIYNSAMDMNGLTYQYQIPYLLTKMTSGLTPDFQNYWITPDQSSPGQRLSLADDWCTKYPVSSSNIISVGGPLANQITEYFNSFTSAFYAEPWFTPYTPWKGTLVSLPCWNKDVYANSGGQNGTGYATIGTYLDLNGTVGLVIYGLDARDTFYATKFFYQDIIQEFQSFPAGATSIVIKISYTDPKHPTFTIPEVLGTISETLVEGIKGGIHPDP